MKLVDIRRAEILANQLYGVETDDFENIALVAWDLINNKHTRLYKITLDTNRDCEIELPCNVDIIKSVHLPVIDAEVLTNKDTPTNMENPAIENYIELWKPFVGPEYEKGKLVNYREEGNVLKFGKPYRHVTIVYEGYIVDDDTGLPKVTEKEAQAIALYIAYASLYKEGIMKKDGSLLQLAQDLYNRWLRACNSARVPERLSDNELNQILDAKVNWNRKRFGVSFRPGI